MRSGINGFGRITYRAIRERYPNAHLLFPRLTKPTPPPFLTVQGDDPVAAERQDAGKVQV